MATISSQALPPAATTAPGVERSLPQRVRRGAARLALCLLATPLVTGCESPGHALVAPNPGLSQLPSQYRVDYDPVFQTPRSIQNSHAEGMYQPGAPAPYSDAEAFRIVRDFVVQYAPVFRFRPGTDDFVATWADGRDGENLVRIQQTYLGLRVDGMGYGASVIPGGEVGSMIGSFMPAIRLSTISLVPAERAASLSIAALEPLTVRIFSAPERVVTTFDLVPRLAWSTVVAEHWLTWTVFVDAQTGKVLSVRQNFIID